jgi:hypothetical protein
MKSITPAIKELERCARAFNKHLFNNELDKNIRILIQTQGRKRLTLGYHSKNRWKDSDGEKFTEITICAEHLLAMNPMDVLLHELCHNYASVKGIKDHSSNGYHNMRFKAIAEMAGLNVDSALDYKGWFDTSIGPKAQGVIDSVKPKMDLFKEVRLESPKAKTYARKFQCPCGMNIRVARHKEFSATCDICNGKFILAD